MDITDAECEAILEKINGSSSPIIQNINNIIWAIQSGDEINYIEDEE